MSVFICHASEDKEAFVRPLAEALREAQVEVWYDEFSLEIGESLAGSINTGLADANHGVAVLSPAFFAKAWPQQELRTLLNRQLSGKRSLILPIRHGVTQEEVAAQFPLVADSKSISSEIGLDEVVRILLAKLRPNKGPVVVAREALQQLGVEPPSALDTIWFDLAEMKESQFRSPYADTKWFFPLPHRLEKSESERGENLACMYLQMDWANDGRERGLCQLTHPDELHKFLRKWPGLLETARQEPMTLALYAPQLTMPHFDLGLEDVFDAVLHHDFEWMEYPDYDGGNGTIDGAKPLCHEVIAFRHETFGNFTPRKLASSFVDASDSHFRRSSHDAFECLTWLLSNDSAWMPARLRETLLEGFHKRQLWARPFTSGGADKRKGPFVDRLYSWRRKGRGVTRAMKANAVEFFEEALDNLGITDAASRITAEFFEREYIRSYDEYDDYIRAQRSKRRSAA